MRDRLLAFFVIAVLSVMIFIFFFIRTQPVPLPEPKISPSATNTIKTPTVTFVDPVRGAANAQVTIVEFADFECVPCKQLIPLLDIAMQSFPNQVRLVWKDLPNDSAHPQATPAAIAAHCAQNQGKFWEYSASLFDNQLSLSEDTYTNIATSLNMNIPAFTKCVANKEPLPLIQKNLQEGLDLGVIATPTLFIGSEPLVGVPTIDEITGAIEKELNSTN